MTTFFAPARRTCLAALAAIVLTACGGGGGGRDDGGGVPAAPAALTPANYVTAASVTVSTALNLFGPLEVLTGARVGAADRLLPLAIGVVRQWPQRPRAPESLLGVTYTETDACDGGGSVSFAITVADESGLAVGDRVRVTFADCAFFGGTEVIDGVLSARVDSVSGDIVNSYAFSVTFDVTLENLSVSDAGSSFVGNGGLTLALDSFTEMRQDLRVTIPAMTVTGQVGGAGYSRTVTNFVIDERMAENGDLLTRIDGRIAASELGGGYVDVETVTPFFEAWVDDVPTAGVALITGAQGSRVRLTARTDGLALIELDADGNGTFELSTTRSWDALAGG